MKRQVVSTCLVGSMLVGTMAAPAMAVSMDKLTDVKTTDWFYPAVQYVAEHDYMIGVGGERFAPTMEMTRSMFVTVLARLEGVDDESAKSNFKDVPDNTWYTKAVNWAAANGIVEGNGADMFLPDQVITRQDMCTMMARYIAYHEKKHNVTHEKKGEEKTFPDADKISSYAQEAVKKCVTWGLVEGNELGYFMPQGTATRAEAATIISRLSWKSNPSGGGGGGGGTTPTTETANYSIKIKLNVPGSVSNTDPELLVDYSNVTVSGTTVTGDKTFGQVANDLVTGENANALSHYINEAMNKVKGKTVTQTVGGRQVTVSVSDAGVVSATATVKPTEVIDNTQGVSLLASQAELETLINKLQAGGQMTFNKADLLVMSDLLDEIAEVKTMTDAQIKEKIDQVVAGKPELEQMASGMTPDAVRAAAADYQVQVEEVMDEILTEAGVDDPTKLPENFTSQITKDPVLMTVAVDLGAYYDKAVGKFNTSKDKVISRLETELGLTFTADHKAKAEAMYALNNPAKYVTDNNDGTLTLKDTADYLKLIQDNVAAAGDFYASLGQNEAFYEGLLERIENKYQDGYGVDYDCTSGSFVDSMAALLGDSDGIMVDGTTFREDVTFSVSADVNEDTYSAWRDLLMRKFSWADILPADMPGALDSLVGNYELTFTIDKQ